MAEHNLIQRADLQQRLTRGLEMHERAPAPVLSPDVQPVVLLADLSELVQFLDPAKFPGAGGMPQAAVVGERSIVALVNPVGSQMVVAVKRVFVSVATASQVQLARGGAGLIATLAFPGGAYFLDSRSGLEHPIRIGFGSDPATQLVAPIYSDQRIVASSPIDIWSADDPPIVLNPGESLAAETIANIALNVDYRFVAWPLK